MSFRDGKPFEVKYRSQTHLLRAIKRNHKWNRTFSSKGHAAAELLELVAIGASITVATTAAGAEIGTLIGGPSGTAVGATIGLGIGLTASIFVIRWYLQVLPPNPDGTVVAVYRTV